MATKLGQCSICGEVKQLSQEHIPPESAFNDRNVLFETLQDALGMSGRRYSKFSGGIKKQSICEWCNNHTGSWYGGAFVEWARQGYVYIDRLENGSKLFLPYHIKPLNVIKQIMVMSLAVNSYQASTYHEDVRRFVLNKRDKYLPPIFRVFAYLNKTGKPRLTDIEGVVMRRDLGAIDYINAEIALPPFGYCVTSTSRKSGKSLAEIQGLLDITWFAQFDYNIWTSVYLALPVRETHEPFPLDYRSKAEVDERHKRNIL